MKKLAICLLLCSCSRGWYGCPQEALMLSERGVCLEVPPESKPGLLAAVASWNLALNGKLKLREGPACSITVIESAAPPCPAGSLACANKLGGSVVYLRRGSYERQPANILAHELGHIFGAQHFEGGLMGSTGAPQSCPDQTTVAQVAAYNHWNLAEMRWCSL